MEKPGKLYKLNILTIESVNSCKQFSWKNPWETPDSLEQCCGSSPFFSDLDPRIRFLKSGSGWPQKDRIRILLRYVLIFSKINNLYFYGIFKPNLNIFWFLNKDKKVILTKLLFRQFYISRKLNYKSLFVDKGSGSGIFPERIRVTQKDRIQIRNTSLENPMISLRTLDVPENPLISLRTP